MRREWIWAEGFAAAVAALLLFSWLAWRVLDQQTFWFDAVIRDALHAMASPVLTHAMWAITNMGSPRYMIALSIPLVAYLLQQGRWPAVMVLAVSAVGAEILDQLLKLIFQRMRPTAFFGYPQPATFSFPSGHSISSACFYGVVAAILTIRMASRVKKAIIWAAAAAMALLIGISRIYLGVHYPSDVLGGYAAAVIWVVAVRIGYDYWRRRQSG